jgi:L-amino acid N-acyltransferase YncA
MGKGFAKVEMDIKNKHPNPFGGIHGGVYSSLKDNGAANKGSQRPGRIQQRSGVAGLLMISLENTARECGFKTMEGIVLPGNSKMLKFAQKRGFKSHLVEGEDDTVHIELQL